MLTFIFIFISLTFIPLIYTMNGLDLSLQLVITFSKLEKIIIANRFS